MTLGMALVRWSPWQDLLGVQRDMDEMFRRIGGFDRYGGLAATRGSWVPAVDVIHRDGDVVVRAELPGIDPEKDVDISLERNVLTIRGERRQEERTNGSGAYRVESSYGAFERSVLLPEGVDADDISATYQNGILEVVVPGAAQLSGGKRIPVRVGEGRKTALTARGRKKS